MLAKINAGTVEGVNGLLVEVEVDIASGLPAFTTVGLPEAAVRESKDRVKAAIKNSGYKFPARRITVNLAPADVRKAGTAYDLPIAVGLLAASEIIQNSKNTDYLMIGELSLDGAVRPVTGVLPIVLAAKRSKLKGVIVPAENAGEAAVVQGINVFAVDNLHQAVEFLAGVTDLSPEVVDAEKILAASGFAVDFSEVKGQEHAKRALEIAAAGGHNLLFEGPPGSGKTMMAKRLASILPDLTLEEALETTSIYSVAGLNKRGAGLMCRRPFRAPHHSISDAGLIGGGQSPRPGEVSMAHNGILFLDEMYEFKKYILEGLRQPLEDGKVTISRAASSLCFPADFVLVAAVNPCPCGYLGDEMHECTCSASQIQRYRARISGPLLDRIDMYVEVAAVPFAELAAKKAGESSAAIKERVVEARMIQRHRFKSHKNIHSNSQMSAKLVDKVCLLDKQSENLLHRAVNTLGLSARSFARIRKIARTVADLAGSEGIRTEHVAEAVQFRRMPSTTI